VEKAMKILGKMPAHNLRFGEMAAVTRKNLSCEIELQCAAELFVEAATPPSRCVVGCKWSENVVEKDVKLEQECSRESRQFYLKS
jgi:hypothetical protein